MSTAFDFVGDFEGNLAHGAVSVLHIFHVPELEQHLYFRELTRFRSRLLVNIVNCICDIPYTPCYRGVMASAARFIG